MHLQKHYEIKVLEANAAIPYDLLLLADETKEVIDTYIFNCTNFILIDKQSETTVGILAFLKLDDDTLEIKNIAIAVLAQSQGLGSYMLSLFKAYGQQQKFKKLVVGTADVGFDQHRFYMRNGFEMDHIRKNFYLDHYPDPIIENDLQLKHMLVFSYCLPN
ncbi:GNAT family N-acetyltransferase [Sphingobacterium sp. SRCM116780]|uniref:GNAT family N-acetyltransferase n=1 Tax=Sphingobacterium sp. SRCM116780 TaxID=2907623 RepID=UPI001F3628EC|nr:GNAT family N-acetyltransferase [Sphingobacterium sp. SRCM116780]UIR56927.1 GNAT family N-acetyltransferase [Sphingobacterium sp. SRCM116780]